METDVTEAGEDTPRDDDLDDIIASVEAKLDVLESKRDELDEDVRRKRAEIEEIENTIATLRQMQDELPT